MLEQRIERALHQGPPFATRYVPSALRLDRQPVLRGPVAVRRLLVILAVTTLLLGGLLMGLAAIGGVHNAPRPIRNGWIAFARFGSGPSGPSGWVERDIYLVREGEAAHRIIGSDTDTKDEICPAFSPDGRRLAHGEAEGTFDAGYRDAGLVISALDAQGNATQLLRIGVGGTYPPPCATWSADGRRVAFGVPLTSPVNPDRSAAGSEVWVVSLADGHVDVLSDLLATDLEWSPTGSLLAIASGEADLGRREVRDGSIRLYDARTRETRMLVGPTGAGRLTWSPDGRRIAYQRTLAGGGQETRVVAVDGGGDSVLTRSYLGAVYGVGPVWSPNGDRIVYQRMKSSGTEAHDVILVSVADGTSRVLPDVRPPGTPESASWRPDSVTWSPDGKELLYSAWSHGESRERRALIVLPLDSGSAPVLLQEDVNTTGENRSWGRMPDD